MYYWLALKLASEFNYKWCEEWLTFMQKANDVMLWW